MQQSWLTESKRAGMWQDAHLHLLEDPSAHSSAGFDQAASLSRATMHSVFADTLVVLTPSAPPVLAGFRGIALVSAALGFWSRLQQSSVQERSG